MRHRFVVSSLVVVGLVGSSIPSQGDRDSYRGGGEPHRVLGNVEVQVGRRATEDQRRSRMSCSTAYGRMQEDRLARQG